MITLTGLTKRYGVTTAVDDLTVEIHPGRVTGFLGPNGAGKSTTMRMIVGLDHPSAGTAMVCGRPYASLRWPLHQVGALLDDAGGPRGRTAASHLLSVARSNRIAARRVDEVLDVVGLADVARRRVNGFFDRGGRGGDRARHPRPLPTGPRAGRRACGGRVRGRRLAW